MSISIDELVIKLEGLNWKNKEAKTATLALVETCMDTAVSRSKKGDFDMILLTLAGIYKEDQRNIVSVFDLRRPSRIRKPSNFRFAPNSYFNVASASDESQDPDCPDCPPSPSQNVPTKSTFLSPIGNAQNSEDEDLPLPSDLYEAGEVDQIRMAADENQKADDSTDADPEAEDSNSGKSRISDAFRDIEAALDEMDADSPAEVLSHFGYGVDDDEDVRERLKTAMDILAVDYSPNLKSLTTMAERIFKKSDL